MARIELWTGLPGSGRARAAAEAVVAAARDGRDAWWITDSRRRAERVERTLLKTAGGALAGVETVIAGRLPQRLLDEAGRQVTIVPPDVREMLLLAILRDDEFRRDAGLELSRGWAGRASRVWARVHAGDADEEAARAFRRSITARFPWMDVLFDRYQARIERSGRADEATLAHLALDALGAPGLDLPDTIVIDRLAPVSHALRRLLRALAGRSARTVVIADEFDTERVAFWNAAGAGGAVLRARSFAADAPAAAFAKSYFSVGPAEDTPPPVPCSLAIAYHAGVDEEVQATAREAARLVHTEGVAEEELAVVCADPAGYGPRLRAIWPRYGLNLDAQLSDPLASRPLASLVHGLLALRTRGMSRELTIALLLNPLARVCRDRASVLLFEVAARRTGVQDGRQPFSDEWEQPIRAEIERMRRRVAREDEEGRSAEAAELTRREADRLEQALADTAGLAKLIADLPDPCPVEALRAWIERCLRELDVQSMLHGRVRASGQHEERLVPGRLDLLLGNVESALRMRGRRDAPLALIAELFDQGLRRMELGSPRRVTGGIPVLAPAHARGLRAHTLFVLGLTDTNWPGSGAYDTTDPFDPESGAQQLAECRALTLEMLLAAPNVVFSVPCPREGESREGPSPLVEELRLAEHGTAREFSRDDARDVFHSPLDLLPEIGRELSGPDTSARERALKRLAAAKAGGGGIDWDGALHAVAVETARCDPTTLTRYEGQLVGTAVAAAIARSFSDRPLSASRLDSYARCPMQFFHRHVLQVEELEEFEEEMRPPTIGALVHEILAKTVLALRARRGGPVDLADDPDETEAVMLEIGRDTLAAADRGTIYWDIEAEALLAGLGDDKPPGRLKLLLEEERKQKRSRLKDERIHLVEAGFGDVQQDGDVLLEEPVTVEADGERVDLRGRIDRVGRHPKKGWRVWDYKTGDSPAKEELLSGLAFQPAIYLWALEEAIRRGVVEEDPIESACYLRLKEEKTSPSNDLKYTDFDDARDHLSRSLISIRRAMLAGRFHHPLAQHDKLCKNSEHNYCPFKHVCRRDHAVFAQRETGLAGGALENAYLTPFHGRLWERREGAQ
ncbi:MAG: ATP-dependent helicase/deoxyribonuclease subunit B [Calditrichaeota bacterium]|nr:ATP-dependent helicase/deoxyribonuclease subunit B [Calditrichota bacterium]